MRLASAFSLSTAGSCTKWSGWGREGEEIWNQELSHFPQLW